MHEISNDGARDQFEALLATVIVPAMIKCARVCLYTLTCSILTMLLQKGERECHLVVLLEEDVIEWDEENPPNMGEDQIQSVFSMRTCAC